MRPSRMSRDLPSGWTATHIEEARYRIMTVRVLAVMTAISTASTALALAGLFLSTVPPDTLVGLLLLSVFFFTGWRMAAGGRWRVVRHVPIAAMFLGAFYGNYIGGMGAPAILMYVLAVVLSAMLQGKGVQTLVFAASLASYIALAVLHNIGILVAIRSDETAFINRILIAASAFIGIAAALRYLIGRLEESIDLSVERGNELAAANEEMQAAMEELEATMEEFEAQNQELVTLNRELETSEERFSTAFNASPAPMSISEIETGRFIDANSRFLEMIGYERDRVIGHTSIELDLWNDPGDRERMLSLFKNDRIIIDFPTRFKTGSGETRDVIISTETIQIERKVVLLSFFYDTTEQKRTGEALRLEEERLNALLELNLMAGADESALTHFAMESAVRLTGSTIGYIAFTNGDETTLTMYAWSKTAMRECAIADKPVIYSVCETGLWGEAIRQRRAVITNDYAAPNPWKKGMPEGHVRVSRHMNVPVFDGTKIVVVAGVGNKPDDYGDDDVRQLTLLMSGLWTIIQIGRASCRERVLRLV